MLSKLPRLPGTDHVGGGVLTCRRGIGELHVRETCRAPPVTCSCRIRLMASMVTGRACRQVKRDHGRAGPSVEVSADRRTAGNHDAGSGRPVTTEADGSMRLDAGQHQFYAGIDLRARSLYAHVLDQRGRVSDASRGKCGSARLEWRRGPDLVKLFGAARASRVA